MDRPTKTTPESVPDVVPDPDDQELAELLELQRLLNGPDRRRITQLRREVEAGRIDVSRLGAMLPKAILEGDRSGRMLQESLRRPITSTLHESIRREPEPMADALFPVMGPAIRRSIVATVESMVESLNSTLELALSPRGWGWRLEAWRSGRPFAEVVLLHTLKYKVEQVLLIERRSGTLLRELRDGPAPIAEADLAASMVSAIEDFCRDSMSEETEGELNSFRFGERRILVENGAHARLALVVAGTPPADLGPRAHQVLQKVQSQLGDELRSFAGDTAPFEAADGLLRGCFERPAEKSEARKKRRKPIPAILAITAALVLLGFWGGLRLRDQRRLERMVADIEADPGWLLTAAEISGPSCTLSVLRDPDAPELASFRFRHSIPDGAVELNERPFLAVDDESILRRATRLLEPPATIELRVERRVLEIEGRASSHWLAEAEDRGWRVHGVEELRIAALPEHHGAAADDYLRRREKMEQNSLALPGALDEDGLAPLRARAAELLRYTRLAQEVGEDPRIIVVVSAAAFSPDAGVALQEIVRALAQEGLDPDHLESVVIDTDDEFLHYGVPRGQRALPQVHWRAAATRELRR